MSSFNPQKKIGMRELSAMIMLVVGVKLADMTPSLLAQKGQNALWIIPIISFIVMFPSIIILLRVLRAYQNKNLIELINHLLGKYIGFVVGLSLFFVSFTATIIDTRSYIDEITTMFFESSPILLVLFIFIGTCYFGARKGFQVIGQTSWLILPYIKLALIVLIFLSFKETIWQRLFPIFGPGFDVLAWEGIKKGALFGELIIFTLAYTSFHTPKDFHRGMYIGSMFVIFEITISFMVYCTIFDYKSIDKIAFMFQEVGNYVSLGNFFTNLETYFFTFWLLAALIRFIVYIYFTSWLLAAVLKIKDPKNLLLPISFIIITVSLIPENPVVNVLVYRDLLINVSTGPLLLLPILLWGVAKWKGDLKKDGA
ncbi:spore gernimation protein [Bacillus sp. HMF5848]|uniref:GerAB/ArcD/ProY family transporter n=1 Tax=Bacillus sp. HMF5848 TaxID=2495421 RepID=UPI000F7B76E8|nr:GerAB/ArcD/ProY family transporter [Bacillus sp. HMF5848]RSK25675.1 spore gernimation protein [Bacillus sp. HMF5848]